MIAHGWVLKEKASLLEKVEHYERDLPTTVPKFGSHTTSASVKSNNLNLKNDLYSNDGDFKNVDRQYEFTYHKNIINS